MPPALENNSAANSAFNIFSSQGYGATPTFPITGLGSRHTWETEWDTFDSPLDNEWDAGSFDVNLDTETL